MAFDPSEEHIKLFGEMAPGIPRKEIIRRLKGNNNNVEQALNEYYDNPDTNKYSSFDTPSENELDGSQENHGILFKIQGEDVPSPHGQYHSAPSRPPSRINNNSPLNNIYSSTGHNIGNDLNEQHQDAELTKALALSAQEAGLNSQESGLSATTFGPATREVYDSNQWSMVPLGKMASMDSYTDSEPTFRKREPNAPAFLKPSIQNHFLAALITIYHEIPLMRNIFLKSANVLDVYRYDKQWWMGRSIELGSQVSSDPSCLDIDQELQRLMAFLDDTRRSYGSIEPLANSPTVKAFSRAYYGSDKACAFLEAWRQRNQQNSRLVDQVFSAGVASEDAEQDERQFAILELTTPSHSLYENLYDICDECLWPELQPLDLASSPYLSHIAEVITFKIEAASDHKRIKFPAVWYPDRYLKHSREASLEMRKKKYEVLEEIDRISRLENRLTSITSANGNVYSVKDILEVSLKHDEDLLLGNESQDERESKDFTNLDDAVSRKLSAELRKLIKSIDKKLDELGRDKNILSASLRQISTLNTYQSPSPEAPILRPYSLRGLRTTQSTTYICQRINKTEISCSENDPKPPSDQWWRVHYSNDSTGAFTLERTTTQKVLTAASEECINPMLVYASEEALSVPKEPLPESLQKFVMWDNRLFNSELLENARSETDTQKATEFDKSECISGFSACSPSKRKYAYGDLDNVELELNRLERRDSESVLDIEALLPSYEDSHLKLDGNLERKLDEQPLVVGIEPSHGEVNDCIGDIDYEMNCSSPQVNISQTEPTDQMDYIYEKVGKNYDMHK